MEDGMAPSSPPQAPPRTLHPQPLKWWNQLVGGDVVNADDTLARAQVALLASRQLRKEAEGWAKDEAAPLASAPPVQPMPPPRLPQADDFDADPAARAVAAAQTKARKRAEAWQRENAGNMATMPGAIAARKYRKRNREKEELAKALMTRSDRGFSASQPAQQPAVDDDVLFDEGLLPPSKEEEGDDSYCKYRDYPLTDIVHPHMHDVLCGRGGVSNHHVGNRSFRELVNEKKRLYLNSSTSEKLLVCKSIVKAMRSQCPPGRFLSKDDKTGLWSDIGDPKAWRKTGQALREGAPVIRREIITNVPGAASGAASGGASPSERRSRSSASKSGKTARTARALQEGTAPASPVCAAVSVSAAAANSEGGGGGSAAGVRAPDGASVASDATPRASNVAPGGTGAGGNGTGAAADDEEDKPANVAVGVNILTGAAALIQPKAASEVDFELTRPPKYPVEPPGSEPIYRTVADLNTHDVLLGRGGGTNTQVGNRRFRQLVQEFQPVYLMARRKEKPLLARTIVLIVRKRGGMFVKKDEVTGMLYEVGDEKAEAKTSQALREGLDVRATKSAANSLLKKDKEARRKAQKSKKKDKAADKPSPSPSKEKKESKGKKDDKGGTKREIKEEEEQEQGQEQQLQRGDTPPDDDDHPRELVHDPEVPRDGPPGMPARTWSHDSSRSGGGRGEGESYGEASAGASGSSSSQGAPPTPTSSYSGSQGGYGGYGASPSRGYSSQGGYGYGSGHYGGYYGYGGYQGHPPPPRGYYPPYGAYSGHQPPPPPPHSSSSSSGGGTTGGSFDAGDPYRKRPRSGSGGGPPPPHPPPPPHSGGYGYYRPPPPHSSYGPPPPPPHHTHSYGYGYPRGGGPPPSHPHPPPSSYDRHRGGDRGGRERGASPGSNGMGPGGPDEEDRTMYPDFSPPRAKMARSAAERE